MKHSCARTGRCQVSWPLLDATEWEGVRHCNNCSSPVFLARSESDASALGSLGHCVWQAPDWEIQPIFFGLPLDDDTPADPTAVLVWLPSGDEEERIKAQRGFALYFSRVEGFATRATDLADGRPVLLVSLHSEHIESWSKRLREWGLVVKPADAA